MLQEYNMSDRGGKPQINKSTPTIGGGGGDPFNAMPCCCLEVQPSTSLAVVL